MTDVERELVSVAASVAAGCELCTDVHVRDARRARASDDEIARSISVALDVREEAPRVMERRLDGQSAIPSRPRQCRFGAGGDES